jgi:2-polyprenyl-3-methyl-5-hydroxy-6-metoxy-1,4-benzoquinol methylase
MNRCEIFKCGKCGVGRASCVQFDPDEYYSQDYFAGVTPDGYADYRGSETVLRVEFGRLVKEVTRYHDGGRLLEIGCAYGYFLLEAKDYFEVHGIELSTHAAATARASGLDVLSGEATEDNLRRLGSFDVIVMLDVIEHLANPIDVLKRCVEHLKPGGIIFITTGNFDSLPARLFGRKWRLMTPPQHLWYFTPRSFRHIAHFLGLRLESITRPWKVVPLSLALYQLGRMFSRRFTTTGGWSTVGIPVNLFDAVRVILRKPIVNGD